MNDSLTKLVNYAERRVGRGLLGHEVNILNWIIEIDEDERDDKIKLLDLFIRTHTNS
ncbi:hypothetical protein [Alkalibacillus haloalkaliphilus]|uniref:hypothetical protein n=1 Tax=Alkalibacillus haloalkaliphilus TaxID=94136 RepID=UPI000306CA9F|nr:hypothetical protein [Alkalibacillus haloalkaliphilus]